MSRLVASGGCDVIPEAFEVRAGTEAEADLLVGDQVSLGDTVVPEEDEVLALGASAGWVLDEGAGVRIVNGEGPSRNNTNSWAFIIASANSPAG